MWNLAYQCRQAVGDGVSIVRSSLQETSPREGIWIKYAIFCLARKCGTWKNTLRLEERFQKDLTELKEETRGRFASLEGFLRKEIESLTDQLKAEQGARQQAVQTLTQELTETAKVFEQRTNQVEEHIVKAQRELRQHILDQSRTLRDEFWVRYRELSEATDRSVQELRAEKTDRATLAVLLTELAMRLGNEYLASGNE